MNIQTQSGHALPFGKYRNQPLVEVPTDYLDWFLRSCKLSGGLRNAVTDELRRRGNEPPPPPAIEIPSCRCGAETVFIRWQIDSLGRRHARAECGCRRFLMFLPYWRADHDRPG
jgi:hypothetical protein